MLSYMAECGWQGRAPGVRICRWTARDEDAGVRVGMGEGEGEGEEGRREGRAGGSGIRTDGIRRQQSSI